MINPTDTSPDSKELAIAALSADTHDALSQSAQLNGRSLHEEAEHIIRSHLRTASLEEPVHPDHA